MQSEDLLFIIFIILICLFGIVIHSVAIRLHLSDYDPFIKPTILVALSFSEITVCVVTIVAIILPFMVRNKVYKNILPYIYCVKLMYVILEHILSIDAILRVRWNIHYNPYKMDKLWKRLIALSLCLMLFLITAHAICSIRKILFKIGLFAESSLIFAIFVTYIYILVVMKRYRLLPVLPAVQYNSTKGRNKQLKLVLKNFRPTLFSVPMLILMTHLPFAGIPNLIFLAFLETGEHVSYRVVYIKFLLSAFGLVIDAILYAFSLPKIRRKIKRRLHRLFIWREGKLKDRHPFSKSEAIKSETTMI